MMTKRSRKTSNPRRRVRPPVLVALRGDFDQWPIVVSASRQRDWRLMDDRYRLGSFEQGVQPLGALVQQLPSAPLVRGLLKSGCPVVRIGNLPHPWDARVPAVMPDLEAEGALAAEHFVERGFKHLGYVGSKPWSDKKTLHDGFKARALELGCTFHLLRFEPGPSMSASLDPEEKYRYRQRLVAAWLGGIPKPLGLLGYVDGMAATLCCMCKDAGYQVPEEVAVLGRGNILSACEGSLPTISSIVPDMDRVVLTSIEMLNQLMQGARLPETTVKIPPRGIVTRESTDILAVSDIEVAHALRFLWDHLQQDLGIDDVAAAIGLTRRSLTRRFRQALGRSITEEVLRKRLSESRRLLRVTQLPIADIAAQVGFKSATYLHRVFKDAHGETPRHYRLRERDRMGKPPSR